MSWFGLRGVADGRAVVVPGLDYRALELLVRVTPRPLRRKLAGRLNR